MQRDVRRSRGLASDLNSFPKIQRLDFSYRIYQYDNNAMPCRQGTFSAPRAFEYFG